MEYLPCHFLHFHRVWTNFHDTSYNLLGSLSPFHLYSERMDSLPHFLHFIRGECATHYHTFIYIQREWAPYHDTSYTFMESGLFTMTLQDFTLTESGLISMTLPTLYERVRVLLTIAHVFMSYSERMDSLP